jgi:hypothetical protein
MGVEPIDKRCKLFLPQATVNAQHLYCIIRVMYKGTY